MIVGPSLIHCYSNGSRGMLNRRSSELAELGSGDSDDQLYIGLYTNSSAGALWHCIGLHVHEIWAYGRPGRCITSTCVIDTA